MSEDVSYSIALKSLLAALLFSSSLSTSAQDLQQSMAFIGPRLRL
jgi:hypothetical protein